MKGGRCTKKKEAYHKIKNESSEKIDQSKRYVYMLKREERYVGYLFVASTWIIDYDEVVKGVDL